MPDISVTVRSSRVNYGYGEAIDLTVAVLNSIADPVFIVTGPPYIWRDARDRIQVLLGESAPGAGFCYYDYEPPITHRLAPGKRMNISLSIGMPLREAVIDKEGAYGWRGIPITGDVVLEVKVGYLKQKFAPRSAGPWAEFLDVQELSDSVLLNFHIEVS